MDMDSDKTLRQHLMTIESLRQRWDAFQAENELVKSMNLQLKQEVHRSQGYREKAAESKSLQEKVGTLTEELKIVRREKENLVKEVAALKFKALMCDTYNKELDDYKQKLDDLLFQIETLEEEKQELTQNLSRFETISNHGTSGKKIQGRSKIFDDTFNRSFSFDIPVHGEFEERIRKLEQENKVLRQKVDSATNGQSNYLLYAKTHIKYIDAETRLTHAELDFAKERTQLQNMIASLKVEEVSILEHESKELAQQVQKLESENGRLRKFKDGVRDYIFKVKD